MCVCVCARLCAQSCPTFCDPMNCSLPGASVHEILQAKIMEWVAISFSKGYSRPRNQTGVSYSSCIGRQNLYHCGTWEDQIYIHIHMCVCVCVCVCEMKVLVAQSYPNFCDPMDYNPPGFSVHGDFSGRNTSRYSFPSLGDLPDPGIEPRSPALQGDSLPSEPPGKLYRYRDRYV